MDEALLRIKVEGEGGTGAPAGGGGFTQQPGTPPPAGGGRAGESFGGVRNIVRDIFGPLGSIVFDLAASFRRLRSATEAAATAQAAAAAVNVSVISAASAAAQAAKPIITPYTPYRSPAGAFGGLLPPPPPEAARMANAAKGVGELVEYKGPYQAGPTRRSGVPATIPEGTPGGLGAGLSMGAMAGIAAIAVAAVAANYKMRSAISGGIGGAGDFLSGMLGPQSPSSFVSGLGSSMKSLGQALPPVVGGLDLLLIGAGAAAEALGKMVAAVDQYAQLYGQYSPQISTAQALADVRQTLGDFRRAQQVGPEMARFVDTQSQLQQTLEDMKARLLQEFLPVIMVGMRIVGVSLPAIEIMIKTVFAPILKAAKALDDIEAIMSELKGMNLDVDPISEALMSGKAYTIDPQVGPPDPGAAINLTGLR